MIDIGIDPDATSNGVAVYVDGVLFSLHNKNTLELYEYLKSELEFGEDITVHIEDIHSMKGFWHKGGSGAARKVGRCEQAQIEVERVCDKLGIKYYRYHVSSAWKKRLGINQFKSITGWTKRSNEDKRSAAYFGWLGTNRKRVTKNGK